ncbi:hypothetical protein, partial [Thermogutta sp.]|uniref:hypothetical protein n=1 Tax=Thermogutta sp. TaxID=1962930 RepID=UPI00321FCE9F
KAVVSGEEIVVRELYCPPFSYRPICKILLAANEAMKMSATDSGLWRRLRRVPFEHVVPEERRSPELKAKLTDPTADDGVHVRAVLRWIVDGAVMWLRDRKLDPPVYVHDLTEELRDELDPISEWIQECCDRSDRRAVTPKDELWKSYLQWCEQEAIKPMDCRIWGKYLKRWCVRIERPRLGGERKRMVVGIRLLDRGSVQPKTVDFSESGQDPFDDLD